MSSTSVSSPASAASPPVLAPATTLTANKLLVPNSAALQAPSILTHKEWVIPPRPKPGRKPAADTPPTKRKAQNRQAQRAFRERRAARVGELEELMKKMEEEDAREQSELKGRIQQLEADLDSYNQLLLSWRQRMQELEANAEEEKRLRETVEAEILVLRNGQKHMTDAVPLPRRSNRQKQQPVAHDPVRETQPLDSYQDIPLGCGNCSQDTRCECIEQVFDINDITTNNIPDASGKRPHSPSSDEDNKRFCPEPVREPENNEIDFTARFSSRKPPKLTTSVSSASIPLPANPDPCGFCKDGTPCICAEMALESMKAENRQSANNITVIPASAPSNPCINGPGTCEKCLVDAKSTLFCKSLAATRRGYGPNQPPTTYPTRHVTNDDELPPTPSSSDLDFGNSEANDSSNNTTNQAITGITLSCADAYETLSRHPAFEKASEELSTWMSELATVPGGRNRTAFEVESASVLGVLKFFDRRFGKTGEK
ncbi:MAG: hypothetical protein Q9166_004515 [cf. Caloplaca sp. 2 TL-2023]